MEIVLKNTKSKYLEIFSLLDLDNIHETFKKFSSIKETFEAKIFVVNESISSHQLLKLKNHFDKINTCSLCIYSNNRDTIISGRSLKIWDGTHQHALENSSALIKTLMRSEESSFIIYPDMIKNEIKNEISLLKNNSSI